LLDKGLTFIPTFKFLPLYDLYSLQNRLVRNLKLQDFFGREEDADGGQYDFTTKTFTHPSTWTPPDRKISHQTLETVQTIVVATESIIALHPRRHNRPAVLDHRHDNLLPEERRALDELRKNDSIVIKPADKGSATVVMDKSAYVTECRRQLDMPQFYRKIDGPIYRQNVVTINAILESMRTDGFISDKQLAYLRASDDDRQRTFYILPKIHKPPEKWPQPGRMPEGRPIVSDCGSESYRVSQYVDSFIRPISVLHPSYIKDTYDFVDKIRSARIPKKALLVTGDVTALYTNMRFDRTIETTRSALRRHPRPDRPDEHLLRLVDVTMRNNDFEFDGECYLQICGMAMGKTYAPGLADIYLEDFDDGAHVFHVVPLLFYRFLDDIFFVWIGTLTELRDYERHLNSLIDGIRITLNWSEESIDFLDTTVYKRADDDCDVLQTRVYFKPTDTHQLLDKTSFHPRHTSRGVLKSQLLRFKRLSSTKSDYDMACGILFKALAMRNYSRSMMRKMKRDIWNSSAILNRTTSVERRLLPIVIPYSNIGTRLARRWKEAICSNTKFDDFRLITAYTTGKSLRRHLVRSRLHRPATICKNNQKTTTINRPLGSTVCHSNRCKACNHIKTGSTFESTHNKRTFKIRGSINCKTRNLVYLVTCRKCHQQYVGETSRSLADRINDHLSAIRLRKPTPTGLHFNTAGHGIRDFQIMGIEHFDDTAPSGNRRIKEITWQNLLQTAYPMGFNNLTRNLA